MADFSVHATPLKIESEANSRGEEPSSSINSSHDEIQVKSRRSGLSIPSGGDSSENELHTAVREFLQQLESNQSQMDDTGSLFYSLESLFVDNEFFQGIPYGYSQEFWSELRKRILHALGKCTSIRKFEMSFFDSPLGNASEVTVFLKALSSNPALEFFRVDTVWLQSSVVDHIAEVIRRAPNLLEVAFGGSGELDTKDAKVLGEALKQGPKIRLLSIFMNGSMFSNSRWLNLLTNALTEGDLKKSLKELVLKGDLRQFRDFLPQLFSSNNTIEVIHLDFSYWSGGVYTAVTWKNIGSSLQENKTLQTINLSVMSSYIAAEDLVELLSIFHTGIAKVGLRSQGFPHDNLLPVLGSVLRRFDSLTRLRIYRSRWHLRLPGMMDMLEALKDNFSLQHLDLDSCDVHPVVWKALFVSLRHNTTLTSLGIPDLDDDCFRDLMGLLHMNSTLKVVSLPGFTNSSKQASVNAALSRNIKLESYFAILKDANLRLRFNQPKAARLFLCGSPGAGKSKLRQTMMRITLNKYWFGDKVAALWRTKGIEVELLKDDAKMQIAIWDMAGQWIFRAIQDLLFPQVVQPCIFLFVFSPYDEELKRRKPEADKAFRTELEEWLRFITSNSQIIGDIRPKVLVVLTHLDKMRDQDRSPICRWATRVMDELRCAFDGVIDLLPDSNQARDCLFLNATKKKHVSPVLEQVLKMFEDLLSGKFQSVPEVCSDLTSMLARKDTHVRNSPVCDLEDLYSFLSENTEDLRLERLNLQPARRQAVLNAVAMYLHDVGSIVLIPDSTLVVVSPNWLTEAFLGGLITQGHNFQAQPSHANKSSFPLSLNGFVSESVLEAILLPVLNKTNRDKERKVSVETLKDLLEKLGLCFKVEASEGRLETQYFIPHIIPRGPVHGGDDGDRPSWNPSANSQDMYFGFRLQCQDRRTSLSSGFFARLQIALRQKVMTETKFNQQVKCTRGYIRLCMNGHEIFVEQLQRDEVVQNHVDVLVRGSQNKTRTETENFVTEHIIDEIRTFCASPKGCRGVILEMGVLRTKCVKELTPFEYREGQAILVSDLRQKFQSNVEDLLERNKDLPDLDEDSLLNYEHTWPETEGRRLCSEFELATDLLRESDVEDMLLQIRTNRCQHLANLQTVLEEVNKTLAKSASKSGSESTGTEIPPRHPSPGQLEGTSVDQFNPNCVVVDHLQRIETKVDGVASGMQRIHAGIQGIKMQLGLITSLQRELQSKGRSIISKVDEMVGLSDSLAQASTPKRPYLTSKDVRILHKAVAIAMFGTPVRLHFECESPTGHHVVEDQEGLELTVSKENFKWLRRIVVISTITSLYALKAGLHATVGLGKIVPELGDLKTAMPVTMASVVVEDFQLDKTTTSTEMNDSWVWLKAELLSRQVDYASVFKLFKVKFKLDDGGYAWVCDKCATRGRNNKTLVVC